MERAFGAEGHNIETVQAPKAFMERAFGAEGHDLETVQAPKARSIKAWGNAPGTESR
jgi:hypothetical protein